MANTDRTPICPYADTAENLALRNDILLQGQIVYNLTNNTYKVGDGESHWTEITTEYKYGENGTIVEDGGSNDFIVNFTIIDETMNCTTDKTFAEIQTAIQEDCNIYGTVEIIQDEIPVSVKVPLTFFNEYGFWFTGIYIDMSLVLTIKYDGTCGGNIATLAHFDALSVKADWGNSLGSYGIMDAYTKTEVDTKLSDKADKATTLAGYGITDSYSKIEVDSKLSSVYKYKGTKDYYFQLPQSPEVGDVYNIRYASGENYIAKKPKFTYILQKNDTDEYIYDLTLEPKDTFNKEHLSNFDKINITFISPVDEWSNCSVLDVSVIHIGDNVICKIDIAESWFSPTNIPDNAEVFIEQDLDNITLEEPYIVNAGDNVAWTGTEWDVLAGTVDMNLYEQISNKVTAIDENSTDEQYPTAKSTYSLINNQIKPLENCFETIVSKNILPPDTEAGYYDNSLNKLNSDRYVRTPERVTLDTTQKNIYVYSKTKLTNEKDTLTISYIKEDGSYLSKHIFSSAINDAVKFNIPVGAVSFVAHIQNYTYSGLTMDDFCISYYPSENGYVPYGEIKRVLNKAEDKIFYVSEDGNDDNDGLSIDSPFATIQKALNLDAHNIAIKRGTYFINNVLEFKDKNNIHIYAYDNDETYSHDSPSREKVNLVGGIYYSNYVKNEDGIYVCEGLTANRVTLIDNEDTKVTILTQVSNNTDLQETDNSFYSDGTNLYFNTSNETFEKIAIPKYNYILTFDNCNNVLVEDITCNVAIKGVITLNNCSGVTFNNCEANYSQADRGFALTNTNAIFNNCTAYRNCVDGFSYHGYGTTIMNECISKWNSDDGCSHHYGCIGTINGGRFTGNGKCGITPAYGANVSIYNAICDQNDNGGIGYLSTDNGHASTKGVVNGCLMMNNTGYGFRTNSLCEVIMLNCKFKDNSLGDIDNQGTLINLDIVE